ncbi:nucleotidyl cyclase domain-containing protein [Mycobacterium antarcticum]|uniref:hypothetical protein n=1 Tax=unclassified Mycolicibacterium TaxID=2636767 RepID=UPI0024E0A062|nr:MULTISPECIES: hypothetical protein [unclassified Mycolicibacterium]
MKAHRRPDEGTGGDDEEVAVTFVDMSGFTALTDARGDYLAAEPAEAFVALTRAALGARDRLLKTIGDAALFTSPTPHDALAALGRIIAGAHSAGSFPIVRAGVDVGPVVPIGEEIYGSTVNVAACLAAAAGPIRSWVPGPATDRETPGAAQHPGTRRAIRHRGPPHVLALRSIRLPHATRRSRRHHHPGPPRRRVPLLFHDLRPALQDASPGNSLRPPTARTRCCPTQPKTPREEIDNVPPPSAPVLISSSTKERKKCLSSPKRS